MNAVMRSQQEITIGAVRPDGTEKPEAQVLEAYARFAQTLQTHLSEPDSEHVTILTSQAAQFSVLGAGEDCNGESRWQYRGEQVGRSPVRANSARRNVASSNDLCKQRWQSAGNGAGGTR